MLSNDACVGRSPLTSEVLKDRLMVISLMVGCRRTQAEMGIVRTEKREHTTGNVDDQLCICGMSWAETETELDL